MEFPLERPPEGLDQDEIKALLNEAADPQCSWQRANAIQNRLLEGVFKGETGEDDGCAEGIKLVLEKLYVETLQNRRALLPTLLPAFISMCGKRDGRSILGDINWNRI